MGCLFWFEKVKGCWAEADDLSWPSTYLRLLSAEPYLEFLVGLKRVEPLLSGAG